MFRTCSERNQIEDSYRRLRYTRETPKNLETDFELSVPNLFGASKYLSLKVLLKLWIIVRSFVLYQFDNGKSIKIIKSNRAG